MRHLSPSWNERQQRAAKLISQQPHAEQLLSFYLSLLNLQEPLYRLALASDWLTRVQSPIEGEFPFMRLERLPLGQLLPSFQQFLRAVTASATDVLADIARALQSAADAVQTELLEHFLSQKSLERLAASLDCEPIQLEFFPRAFVQPIAEALAEQSARKAAPVPAPPNPLTHTLSTAGGGSGKALTLTSSPDREKGEGEPTSCPQCGWPPQVAVIRDEPEVKGRRLLLCSLCATMWSFPRAVCPNCGEARPDQLVCYVGESMSHVRVEECRTCRGYLKSVDLRESGIASPLVEDLASVELDLWSEARELRKIQRNVLGL